MMELTRQRAAGASRRPSPQKQKEEIEHADLQASRAHRSRLRRPRFDRRLRRQGRRHRIGHGGRVAPSKTLHDASLGAALLALHGRRFCVRSPDARSQDNRARAMRASAAAASRRALRPDRNRYRLGRRPGQIVEQSPEALGQLFQSLAERGRLPSLFLLAVRQAVLPARFSKYRPGAGSGRHCRRKKPSRRDVP